MLTYRYPKNWSYTNYWGHFYIHTYPNPKNIDELMPETDINDCREFFVRLYRERINKFDGFAPCALKTYALTTPGMPESYNFGSWNTSFQEGAQKGLYIVNSFEKAHIWPLTKVYPVDARSGKGSKIPAVFWSGPRKWTTSPYLLSIWSLCIRLGRNSWLPKKLMTLNHEDIVRQIAIAAATVSNSGDAAQVSTIRQWDTFLSLYRELFGDKARKHHWDKAHLNGVNDRPEGIRMLLKGTTAYKELSKKYKTLKKEKKLK